MSGPSPASHPMNPTPAATLANLAAQVGITIDADMAGRLVAYLEALLALNEEVNLTAIRTLDEGISRHLLDGLAVGLHVADIGTPPGTALDIGTGGGFPAVPMAALLRTCRVTALDGTRKKTEAVRKLAASAGIPLTVRWGRAEELAASADPLRGTTDLVTLRAVAPLAKVVGLAAPFLRRGGHLVAWKSRTITEAELAEGVAIARSRRLERLPDIDYEAGQPARLIRFRRLP